MKDLQAKRDELTRQVAETTSPDNPMIQGIEIGFDAAVKEMEARYAPLVDAAGYCIGKAIHAYGSEENLPQLMQPLLSELAKLKGSDDE